jgi:hypothetical protein
MIVDTVPQNILFQQMNMENNTLNLEVKNGSVGYEASTLLQLVLVSNEKTLLATPLEINTGDRITVTFPINQTLEEIRLYVGYNSRSYYSAFEFHSAVINLQDSKSEMIIADFAVQQAQRKNNTVFFNEEESSVIFQLGGMVEAEKLILSLECKALGGEVFPLFENLFQTELDRQQDKINDLIIENEKKEYEIKHFSKRLTPLLASITEVESKANQLSDNLETKDATILELENEIKARDENLEYLNKNLLIVQSNLERAQREIALERNDVHQFKQKRLQFEEQIRDLQQALENKNLEFQTFMKNIQGSLSWKVTAPLRGLFSLLRK